MKIIVGFLSLILFNITWISALNESSKGIHIQIFDNIAEISQPISLFNLPMTYSQQEWNDIRADSFRLVGNHLNVQAQIVSFNRTSSNGEKILIQRSVNNDTFTDAIMIDETRNLIYDLIDRTYYMINSDRIKYFTVPLVRKYVVDFMVDTVHTEQVYLRYLQKNIKWKVRYDLLLETNDSDSILQAYADIRNDGNSLLMIDSAELITGDVNIQSSAPAGGYFENSGFAAAYDAVDGGSDQQVAAASSTPAPPPSISQGAELAGVYVFSINETFILDPRSNYILPMFRPTIAIERYGLIEKYFRRMDNRGNGQRAYRLRAPDRYLPKGHVFVRESNRLVGEIYWSDHTANETNEFNIGEDPDLQYTESIQLVSRRQAYEANGYRFMLSTYTINLRLINNKNRSMNIEYRLRFSSQDNLTLKEDTDEHVLQLDGSTISGVFQLNSNDEHEITFTIETQ